MKKIMMTVAIAAILGGCASQQKNGDASGNPLLSEYTTPYQVPPFDQIKVEHYKPAFLKGMEEEMKEKIGRAHV